MKKTISLAILVTAIFSAQAQSLSSARGKQLFLDRCTSCHSVAKEVVGPALKDVGKRRSEEWIVSFVHSSQTVIKSGDTAAVRLFESHNRTVMPDHPDLSRQDIDGIVAYITEESARINAQPAGEGFVPDEPPLYPGNKNVLHRLVYLDLPGEHRPLKLTDYWVWAAAFGSILLLIFTMLLAVRVKSAESDL